jgi:hypothetical protein
LTVKRDSQVSVAFRKQDKDILEKGCEAIQENVGSFVRQAALKEMARRGWLTDERRKLLGV